MSVFTINYTTQVIYTYDKILNINKGIHSFQNSFTGAQMFKDHYTGSSFFYSKAPVNLEPQEISHLEQLSFPVISVLYSLSTIIVLSPNFINFFILT